MDESKVVDENLYSRQLGVYGMSTMKRLVAMKVLIVGLKGVGVEVGRLPRNSTPLYQQEHEEIPNTTFGTVSRSSLPASEHIYHVFLLCSSFSFCLVF